MVPIKVDMLRRLLKESNYNREESEFLLNGFINGFDIGYEGPEDRSDTSRNVLFRDGVGSKQELWEKLIKEVQLKRYAGPFEKITYRSYIQFPIGLVLKAGGKRRQIFHLSYDFKGGDKSVNFFTLTEKCTVKYNDIDMAIRMALKQKRKTGAIELRFAKSAFRILPPSQRCFKFLIMKCKNPED